MLRRASGRRVDREDEQVLTEVVGGPLLVRGSVGSRFGALQLRGHACDDGRVRVAAERSLLLT